MSSTSDVATVSGTVTFGDQPKTQQTDPNSPAAQKELFLNLLVAQMKNQDPTSPMDPNQMMSQMSQMSEVEQLTNMAQTLSQMQTSTQMSQGVSMIGAQVSYLDSNNNLVAGATVTGVIAVSGSAPKLQLDDGSDIDLSAVTTVQ